MITLSIHNTSDININGGSAEDLVNLVINRYALPSGTINLIITDDDTLRKMKKKYFNEDYFTDVIAFNIDENPFEGEIYISHQRVRDNAVKYKQNFEGELKRVIIHGALHLCGQKDSSEKEKSQMTSLEDSFLGKFDQGILS